MVLRRVVVPLFSGWVGVAADGLKRVPPLLDPDDELKRVPTRRNEDADNRDQPSTAATNAFS